MVPPNPLLLALHYIAVLRIQIRRIRNILAFWIRIRKNIRTYVRTYFGCVEEIVYVASLIQLYFS